MTPSHGSKWLLNVVGTANFIWLVVWNMNFIFPYIGNNDPNWRTHIFQRGSNHQPAWEASLFQERGGKALVAEPSFVIFFAGYLRVRVRLAMNNAYGMYVVQKIHIICINIYIYILTIIKTKTCISMVIWFSMYSANAYMMFSLLLDVWNTESEWCNLTFELLKSWRFHGPFQ